jgi:hypothetical protein
MRGAGELMRIPPVAEVVKLQKLLELLPSQLTITKHGCQQPRTNRLAGVDWNHGATTVSMTQEMMTTANSNDCEAGTREGCDQSLAGDGWQPGHTATVTL